MGCYITTASRLRLLAHQHVIGLHKCVCVWESGRERVAVLHQISEEKMTETEQALSPGQDQWVCVEREREGEKGEVWAGPFYACSCLTDLMWVHVQLYVSNWHFRDARRMCRAVFNVSDRSAQASVEILCHSFMLLLDMLFCLSMDLKVLVYQSLLAVHSLCVCVCVLGSVTPSTFSKSNISGRAKGSAFIQGLI